MVRPLPALVAVLVLAACQVESERKASRPGAPEPGRPGIAAPGGGDPSLFEDPDSLSPGIGASPVSGAAAASGAAPDGAPKPALRAVSLKAVDRILADCAAGSPCGDSLLLRLGDISALLGLAFDEGAGDVVLFGEVRPGVPPLRLEDLVVALRNAWLAYVEQKGNRITYLHPGVSLEPAPAAVKELRKIARDIARIQTAGSEKALERWKEVCRRPYRVVVTGLPPDSRFARVLLEADYAMKGLANGAETPAIPGFPVMAELRRIRHQGDPSQGLPAEPPAPSLTRYWFHPGNQEWEMAEGIVVLKRCPVMLMTETRYGALRSDSAAAGPGDDLAEAFAYGFTRMYDEVAARKPAFRELEGMFRLVAAAKLVRDRYPESESRAAFPALAGGWMPRSSGAAGELPGIPDLQHFDVSRSTPLGMEIDRYWLPSCGGVNVAVEPSKAWIRRLRDPRLSAFRKALLAARPAAGAWQWDVAGPGLEYWDALRERMRMQELCQRLPDLAFYRLRPAGDGRSRDLELVDEDDYVLKRDGAAGVLEDIAARAEARKVRSVFLEMAGWPAERARDFRAAAADFTVRRGSAWKAVPVVGRPGWLSADNPVFAHSAEWEPGEPPVEAVESGAFRGWHRVTFRFRTSAGGRSAPAVLHVMAKSAATAARLQEHGSRAFRSRLFIAYSPIQSLMAVVSEFRDSLPPEERGDLRIVEDGEGALELG